MVHPFKLKAPEDPCPAPWECTALPELAKRSLLGCTKIPWGCIALRLGSECLRHRSPASLISTSRGQVRIFPTLSFAEQSRAESWKLGNRRASGRPGVRTMGSCVPPSAYIFNRALFYIQKLSLFILSILKAQESKETRAHRQLYF